MGYIFFAFFISLIRELVKDMQDLEGDKAVGLKTWPIVFGLKGSKILIYMFTGIEILLCGIYSYLAWDVQFYISSIIMGLITIALFYFINKVSFSKQKEDFAFASTLLKVLMFVGVFNILFS
jgi:4-hydroxybenzoate polyprenyltransferase